MFYLVFYIDADFVNVRWLLAIISGLYDCSNWLFGFNCFQSIPVNLVKWLISMAFYLSAYPHLPYHPKYKKHGRLCTVLLCAASMPASMPLYQSDDEGLDLLEQIVARIVIYFHGDRLAQIQAEYAQYGLGVHYMATGAQIHVVGILIDDVNKSLDVFGKAQFDIDSFH